MNFGRSQATTTAKEQHQQQKENQHQKRQQHQKGARETGAWVTTSAPFWLPGSVPIFPPEGFLR